MSMHDSFGRAPRRAAFHGVPWLFHGLLLALLALAGTGLLWSARERAPRAALADRPAGSGERPAAAAVELAAPAPRGEGDAALPGERSRDRVPVRERLPARPLAGILRSPAGATHAGATLSWTVLLPELEGRDFLREVDPERLRELTVTTTSDASGRFAFEAAPAELGDASSVVWVTHAGTRPGASCSSPAATRTESASARAARSSSPSVRPCACA